MTTALRCPGVASRTLLPSISGTPARCRSVGRSVVCEFLCTFGDSSGGRPGSDVQEHSHHIRLGGVGQGGLGQNDEGQAVGDSSGMDSMDGPVDQRVGNRSAFAQPVSEGDLLFGVF
ncbi:hypothetical protein [Rhodococcus sp. EPR-157]|uniref:hypothetical protein n=1 Tax=Rhodococcus sp. EPR-157 TaxID=1813677 RepID=UPI001E5EA860|nr:hypothetical protein [Rhodococcus sp. EPR-157]